MVRWAVACEEKRARGMESVERRCEDAGCFLSWWCWSLQWLFGNWKTDHEYGLNDAEFWGDSIGFHPIRKQSRGHSATWGNSNDYFSTLLCLLLSSLLLDPHQALLILSTWVSCTELFEQKMHPSHRAISDGILPSLFRVENRTTYPSSEAVPSRTTLPIAFSPRKEPKAHRTTEEYLWCCF